MSMGAFEVLLELLDVRPQLPGGAPLTVRATSRGWKFTTRTDAVTALRLMAGCTVETPPCSLRYIHSGRIGGGTQLAAQGTSQLQIQRAGRWKSGIFMTHVREAGEGAEVVSAALAQTR